ncbi:MAG: helix-turn-helix domain-containing protein [Chloroflexota bacterium]
MPRPLQGRRKLGDDPARPRYIVNDPGVGYRLNGSGDRIIGWVRGKLQAGVLGVMVMFVSPGGPPPGAPADTSGALVGFSFSSPVARAAGQQPSAALHDLLWRLHPDLVRLPVYWSEVAPEPGVLDFTELDALLGTIDHYNRTRPQHHTRVVLVAGARNLATPELHLPAWMDTGETLDLETATSSRAYFDYLEACFHRYWSNPLMFAWQIENEPLDSTNDELGDIALTPAAVAAEVVLLKSVDPVHPVVVTTFNSSTVALDRQATSRLRWLYDLLPGPRPAGHPALTLGLGDVLGLDLYVVTPSTPLDEADVEERVAWKAEAINYWAAQARKGSKQTWITEMQAAPWDGYPGFTPDDLALSAEAYSRTDVDVVLLWGVEYWLGDPTWMRAGREAMATIRGRGLG